MVRRIHAAHLQTGDLVLTAEQAHHLRKVLRLSEGEAVEVFDDNGRVGTGAIHFDGSGGVSVTIDSIAEPIGKSVSLTIVSAVPKGERADWMIEKLSEIGVDHFVPLAAARSVVLPDGRNKQERWLRIAREAAEQSRGIGTMRIERLKPVDLAIKDMTGIGWVCSTEGDSTPLARVALHLPAAVTLFIGPEGGWTAEELAAFSSAGIKPVSLVQSILRIETAAVLAAGVVMSLVDVS